MHLSSRLFILGFSAGGHIAALYNDYWSTDWLADLTGINTDILQPTKIILGYPVIDLDAGFPTSPTVIEKWTDDPNRYQASKHVNDSNVPTFIWHTMDDPMVPVQNSINYSLALKRHGMDIANKLVAHHKDGSQPHVAHWVTLADEWLQEY